MDYARFVGLRRDSWNEFEHALEEARGRRRPSYGDLERLAIAYRRLLHDHALCSARFPGTAAAERLHALVLAGTHLLHADAPPASRGVRGFLTVTFPREFQAQLRELAVAASLFGLGLLFGLLIGLIRPEIGTALVGPERLAGLREGRLWTESLTTTVPPSVSSSMIATNNMSVALASWVGGAVGGLGSLYICLLNGVMLGGIVAVTLHWGLAGDLLEFVSAHGLLEITLILVASAAGLRVARGMIAPGDRPRATAARDEAMGSLRVLLGCLPWFLLLGAVEAFVSPSPHYPVVFKVTSGVALEAVFLVVALNPSHREAPDASV